MKKFMILLAVASCLLIGCKKRNNAVNAGVDTETTETPVVEQTTESEPVAVQASVSREDFPIDELFSVFSLFGKNIMTDKFASQAAKDRIKDNLRNAYQDSREYNWNTRNHLEYDQFDGDCYDGFQLGCWRYDADGHLLVLIAENGGCDVNSTKYLRAYEYDPDSKNAREVDIPLNPVSKADDFEDLIRMAGCDDIPYVREMMRDQVYNYGFSPEGLEINMNTVNDWQVSGQCGFQLFTAGTEVSSSVTRRYPIPASIPRVLPRSSWVKRCHPRTSITTRRIMASAIPKKAPSGRLIATANVYWRYSRKETSCGSSKSSIPVTVSRNRSIGRDVTSWPSAAVSRIISISRTQRHPKSCSSPTERSASKWKDREPKSHSVRQRMTLIQRCFPRPSQTRS
ncbi:MAG: hypothetical protein IJK90_06260 [Bacteroidales bacterium]|nr:hypothetical protein [Bacteroidales bacterium]